jgi:CheY-like chemotaxis protein
VRILLVENHRIFAATVATEFLASHELVTVGSVFEALDLFRGQAFDLALVDYDLDDGKGDAFVRRVRERDPGFAIVAISAHADGNAALMAAGADVVCAKSNFRSIAQALEAATRERGRGSPAR